MAFGPGTKGIQRARECHPQLSAGLLCKRLTSLSLLQRPEQSGDGPKSLAAYDRELVQALGALLRNSDLIIPRRVNFGTAQKGDTSHSRNATTGQYRKADPSVWGTGVSAYGANELCPQIGQYPPISGMRCPQWPHDFEPIALGFRFANHQTMNAINASGTSTRKSRVPSMTISSGKPRVRIGRSVSNFCRLWWNDHICPHRSKS